MKFNQASRIIRTSFLAIVVLCVLTLPLTALATHPWEEWADEFGLDPDVSYDGTRVMTMIGGEFEATERKAPQKMYSEFNMGNISGAFILREDLDKAYTLMPTMGMYREMSLSEGLYESGGGMEFSDIEKLGEETVNGHPSTKYKARFVDKEGRGAGFIWVTHTGVPIKMDMVYSSNEEQGMRISSELVNLNLRAQDPEYFELPEGLNPMGMSGMAGLSGMFSGGQSNGDNAGGASMLDQVFQGMTPEQREALSGAGLEGLMPGGAQQPQAAPAGAGSSATAMKSESMSKQLTTDNLTQSIQYHLQYLGIDPGNTEGENSLDTQIAISEYEASRGMKVTGKPSPQLLGVLSADVDSQ